MWQGFKNIFHLFQADTANALYGFAHRKIKIIGVTGTDGKTTTSSIIYHVLKRAGYKAALITSVSAIIDGQAQAIGFHVTTPRFFALRSLIKKARKAGAEYLVLEVTSHALDQHRVRGISFEVGVLTNITNEHLDYHKSYGKYARAKLKLLRKAKFAIVNKDDKSFNYVKKYLKGKKYMTYGMKKDADINLHNFPFQTKLIGKFNKYNCLAAIAALEQLNIPKLDIVKGIASFKPPAGRQEVIYDRDFKVIVDFAHTPNSFREILPEVKKIAIKRLIHVFGSAGERDAYKRAEMGKISSEFADVMVITAEDPRSESVEKITAEIESGIGARFDRAKLLRVMDRKEAIRKAIEMARPGDIVLLTGKGHESSMNYGRGEVPWSEQEVAKEAVRDKK